MPTRYAVRAPAAKRKAAPKRKAPRRQAGAGFLSSVAKGLTRAAGPALLAGLNAALSGNGARRGRGTRIAGPGRR